MDEKPQFEQKRITLALLSFCIVWEKGYLLYNKVFFLKRETLFSTLLPYQLSYSLINFLLFSQKIYLGFCPNSLAVCSSYSLRNMAEYKNRCQVIIFLFWTLLQLRYYLVAGGERMSTSALWHEGGWLCHYMGNNSWAMRGTSKVLQMIHVSLKWSNIHSANEGCFYSTWP